MRSFFSFILVITLLAGCASTQSAKSDSSSITFKYSVTGILDGYDHVAKLVVYADGNKIGESTEKKQSEGNAVTLPLSVGKHKIRAVLNALYEGKWEEHLKENEYSLDALFDEEVTISGNTTITLVFDITNEKTIVK